MFPHIFDIKSIYETSQFTEDNVSLDDNITNGLRYLSFFAANVADTQYFQNLIGTKIPNGYFRSRTVWLRNNASCR